MKKQWFIALAALLVLCLACCSALAEYADGSYTGVAKGNNGDITVEVTVEGGAVTAVTVTAHSETAGLSDPAFNTIPDAIVAAGTTEGIDTCAGCTNSSKGILEAVNAALASAVAEEAPAAEETTESDHGDPSHLKDWDAWEPTVKTMANGVRVQAVPDACEPAYGGTSWNFYAANGWKYYNTYFLNAENRGCTACHTLQWAMKQINHCIYDGAYPTDEMTYQSCVGCHSSTYSGMGLQQPIHTTHLRSSSFSDMGGSCESCHYIDSDGNYLRWDFVKYDVMYGITSLSTEDMADKYSIEWNQTELTPSEYVFGSKWGNSYGWGMTENNAFGYSFDYLDQFKTEDYMDTYKITIGGNVEKPGEYSLNELIEACGSKTQTFVTHCTINGNGGSFIYQGELTGIMISDILDFVGAQRSEGDILLPLGYDNYYYSMTVDHALEEDAMLVYLYNGEPLSDIEGFPVAYNCKHISAGNMTRTVVELDVLSAEEGALVLGEYYGDFLDDYTGYNVSKPNIGVLTAYNGQIFTPGETVHLEGYASAYEEPILSIEFSFDKGETWFTTETTGADSERWVYWKMDINDLPEGAYVIWMRTTSLNDETGEPRVIQEIPKYMFNVKY